MTRHCPGRPFRRTPADHYHSVRDVDSVYHRAIAAEFLGYLLMESRQVPAQHGFQVGVMLYFDQESEKNAHAPGIRNPPLQYIDHRFRILPVGQGP